MNKEDSIAYTEVLEILKYIPKEKYDLISENILNTLMQNQDEKYDFTYNVGVPFSEQNISEKAKEILRFLDENYWKKDDYQKIVKKNNLQLNELFPKSKKIIENENTNILNSDQESWFNKICKKIKQNILKLLSHIRKI